MQKFWSHLGYAEMYNVAAQARRLNINAKTLKKWKGETPKVLDALLKNPRLLEAMHADAVDYYGDTLNKNAAKYYGDAFCEEGLYVGPVETLRWLQSIGNTDKERADLLGVSVSTLRRWREAIPPLWETLIRDLGLLEVLYQVSIDRARYEAALRQMNGGDNNYGE